MAKVSNKQFPKKLFPMEAKNVNALPQGVEWRYEPKRDGFRCLAFKDERGVCLQAKSGTSLNRYFPDVVTMLEKIKTDQFILDGELLIEKDHAFSFEELQQRLHPAESRVRKLAAENPATFVTFDILADDKGVNLMDCVFCARRGMLEKFFKKFLNKQKFLILSPQTASLKQAEEWIAKMKGNIDGIVAKNVNDIYRPAERQMQKYKFIRTADCVVGGFRYGRGSKVVGSLLLGLYDNKGLLNHVGFTSGIARTDKAALTRKLEKLIGKPGFTGKAPGGPSRWSTNRSAEWQPLKSKLVVEVSFDHVSNDRFRHGTNMLRWRPDKAPKQCSMEQLTQARI